MVFGARSSLVTLPLLWLLCCADKPPHAEPDEETPEPIPPIEQPKQPVGWDEDIALPIPEDLDPDPNVLEVNIEAREAEIEFSPGVKSRVWSYNGSVPGPLLRVRRGDRIVVHFTNRLPEPTTLHWHGVHVPSTMDGTTAAQDPVEPGETFTYDFVVPVAGTYWYHPHIDSSAQVGYGLYGALIVEEPDDPLDADDLVIVLSDMSLDSEGQLLPGDQSGWFGDYFGREGSAVLVNGKVSPRLVGGAGLPQRWRIINAARARVFKVSMPGVPLVRVGGDTSIMDRPLPIEYLRLAPSERAELLVVPPAGEEGEIEVLLEDSDRFHLGIPEPPELLFPFDVRDVGETNPFTLPETLHPPPHMDLSSAKPRRIEFGEKVIDGTVHLTIDGYTLMEHHDGSDHGHDHAAAYTAVVYDTEVWEVVNTTSYDHPFHLHGFSFEVLDRAGVPWPVREWKDTVNVPRNQTVRFAVTFDDRPGVWMFHCHILDHVNLGMMAALEVRRP